MKKSEYAKLHNLKTEQDWMNHFRRNMSEGKGPVALYLCPACDEILENPPDMENHSCIESEDSNKKSNGITIPVTTIDWAILRRQKEELIEITEKHPNLNGIVHLIDTIQDKAVDELGIPELKVFGGKYMRGL